MSSGRWVGVLDEEVGVVSAWCGCSLGLDLAMEMGLCWRLEGYGFEKGLVSVFFVSNFCAVLLMGLVDAS